MGAGMSSRDTTNIGHEFRVGDYYVWAEIHYLDSATDYRECLPQKGTNARIRSDDLILLDSARQSCLRPCLWWYFLAVLLIFGYAILYEML
jgi:hypothetical protein